MDLFPGKHLSPVAVAAVLCGGLLAVFWLLAFSTGLLGAIGRIRRLRAELRPRKETALSLAVLCASLGIIAFGELLPLLWRDSPTLAYGIHLATEWKMACLYCGGVSLLVSLAGYAIGRSLRDPAA